MSNFQYNVKRKGRIRKNGEAQKGCEEGSKQGNQQKHNLLAGDGMEKIKLNREAQ
jgi:hypothetical protein